MVKKIIKRDGRKKVFDPQKIEKAIYKGFLAANMNIPTAGGVFVALRDSEKNSLTIDIIRKYKNAGFQIYASKETTIFLNENGIKTENISYEKAKQEIIEKQKETGKKKIVLVATFEVEVNSDIEDNKVWAKYVVELQKNFKSFVNLEIKK